MRLIAGILSIYILALVAYPCTDHPGDNHSDMEHERIASLHIDHTGHDHADSDTCSPFCQCACCQIHMNEPVEFHLQVCAFQYADDRQAEVDNIISMSATPASPPPRA